MTTDLNITESKPNKEVRLDKLQVGTWFTYGDIIGLHVVIDYCGDIVHCFNVNFRESFKYTSYDMVTPVKNVNIKFDV